MAVNKLSSFLERYLKLTPPSEIIRSALAEALQEAIKVPVLLENIRIDRGVAYVTASALIKNEIFMRKADILAKVKEKAPKAQLSDIR